MVPLWDIFDGEPFMENPALGILSLSNGPKRRKRKGVKMAVRRRRRKMTAKQLKYFGKGRKRAAPRRRRRVSTTPHRRRSRRRRNWAVAGSVVPMNPPRRRSRRRANPHRRHHRRRNPGLFSMAGIPPVKSVLFAGLGFAGPSLVSGFLISTFPSIMQQTTNLGVAGKYIVKIGSILGLSWLTRRFVGSNEAHMVMIGGGANIALSLVNDFAPGMLPANPLSMYLPTIFPTMQQQAGMRSYVPLRGLAAGRPLTSAAAFPTYSAVGRQSPAYGGVAARFKRF
jgi:hypothetical protein